MLKKIIPGLEDRYSVSVNGDVFSFLSNRYLRQNEIKSGYLQVKLYYDRNKSTSRLVHRLVAEAFIPNPNKKPQVNHKDGDKMNNKIANLEWATNSENQLHAFSTGLSEPAMKGKFGGKHHNAKKICKYSKEGALLTIYDGIREASRIEHIADSSIIAVANGRRKTAGGFVWKYL